MLIMVYPISSPNDRTSSQICYSFCHYRCNIRFQNCVVSYMLVFDSLQLVFRSYALSYICSLPVTTHLIQNTQRCFRHAFHFLNDELSQICLVFGLFNLFSITPRCPRYARYWLPHFIFRKCNNVLDMLVLDHVNQRNHVNQHNVVPNMLIATQFEINTSTILKTRKENNKSFLAKPKSMFF